MSEPRNDETTKLPTTDDSTTDQVGSDSHGSGDRYGSREGATPTDTTVMPTLDQPESEQDRASARADRDRALGVRPVAATVSEDPVEFSFDKGTNDKFLASFGLFVLRLATALVLGVHGVQKLMDLSGTQAFFASTALPYPQIAALVTAIAEVLIALALVFGLLTRLAGLGALLIGVGALVFVKWLKWPLVANQPGFAGEPELLLAAIGLLMLCVGGGWWSLDAAFRRGRARRKAGL